MRRFVSTLASLAFAASLHASVPSATPARLSPKTASVILDQSRVRQPLPITAAPADNVSFYLEFYGTEQLPSKAERKTGLLHWLASTMKKTAQKVNFFN